MLYYRISTDLSVTEINKLLDDEDAIIVSLVAVTSELQLELAEHLAKSSFEQKINLANKFKYEFLLWLTGKRDIRSAMNVTLPKNTDDSLLVIFGKTRKFENINLIKIKLSRTFNPIALERISTSRVF